MYRLLLIVTIVLLATPIAYSQNFSLEHDTVFAVKPADFFTFYAPNHFTNNAGTDLQLRWVKEDVIEEYETGHGGNTGLWGYSLQDPSNYYSSAINVDSADFVLPANTGTTDNFIIQVYPNEIPGHLFITFRIFEIGNPDNYIYVYIDYTATAVVTSIENIQDPSPFLISTNLIRDGVLRFSNTSDAPFDYQIWSISGMLMASDSHVLPLEQKEMMVNEYVGGVYFLEVRQNGKSYLEKFIIPY